MTEKDPVESVRARLHKRLKREVLFSAETMERGVTVLPTGIFSLDTSLLGGVHENRITYIYGNTNSGKSYVIFKTLAAAQRKYPDSRQMLILSEDTADAKWLEALGIDLSRLDIIVDVTLEECADIMEALLDPEDPDTGNLYSFIAIDSLMALLCKKESEISAEDSYMGKFATAAKQMIKKTNGSLLKCVHTKRKKTVMVSNNYTENIGKMFGDKRTLTGGVYPRTLAQTHIELIGKKYLSYDQGVKEFKEISIDGDVQKDFLSLSNHDFKIKKLKGSSLLSGEFNVCHMFFDGQRKFSPGEPINTDTIYSMLRTNGLIEGEAKSKKRVTGFDCEFRIYDDILAKLFQDPEFEYYCAKLIMQTIRKRANKDPLPPDNYLLGEYHEDA